MAQKNKKKNKEWHRQHVGDHHVRLAREKGFRSRAAFKLLEIQRRDKIFRVGMNVADLGAAPGSWSQVIAKEIGKRGTVVAIDCLDLRPVEGVIVLKKSLLDQDFFDCLSAEVGNIKFDVVVSDLAPNMSGIPEVDQSAMLNLMDVAIKFTRLKLKPGGTFLVKVFEGLNILPVRSTINRNFKNVSARKPQASRRNSAEFYLVGRQFVGLADRK